MSVGAIKVNETRVYVEPYGNGLVTAIIPHRGSGKHFQPGQVVVLLDDGQTVARSYYDLQPERKETS